MMGLPFLISDTDLWTLTMCCKKKGGVFYCVLGPFTKMTQIGKWPKNELKVFQIGAEAS